MSKQAAIFLILLAALAGGVASRFLPLSGAHHHTEAAPEKKLFTCGMHPQVVQDHPGNCPICGMKLTPVRKPGAGAAAGPAAAESTVISIDPVTIQNMGIRTALVTKGPLRRTIRTVGVVDYDESALADVTTKFKGWIEKLYVDSMGKQVHRGDPLFEIYSPELYSAQTEYLLALSAAAKAPKDAGTSLLDSARLKLKFFDISDAQIAELEKTHEPKKTLKVSAPIDGYVTEKSAVEGMMTDAGMKLYRLADLGIVWVQAQVYEQDLGLLQLGQEAVVSLSYMPDRKFRGRVTYIYPTVDQQTRTARVRMEFHNPGFFLKPGMFASVEVAAELSPAAVLVPDAAVLRSGEKNTVFVALDGGKFDPRTVVLGMRAEDDRYQVLSGLQAGERVVTSGQFMLDSESQLREAIAKMREPAESEAGAASQPAAGASPAHAHAAQAGASLVYVCPMPEHVSIQYDHAGKCPVCGMTLVPVTRSMLEKIQPGGKVLYYTCPMPEHSDVHLAGAGKCPKCGMTLIPVMSKPAASAMAPAAPAAKLPTLYTCPMASHADVVFDHPGKCTKCEMELVPTSTVKHGKTAEANWLKLHPAGMDPALHQH